MHRSIKYPLLCAFLLSTTLQTAPAFLPGNAFLRQLSNMWSSSHTQNVLKVSCATLLAGICLWLARHAKTLKSYASFCRTPMAETNQQALQLLDQAFEQDIDTMLYLKQSHWKRIKYPSLRESRVKKLILPKQDGASRGLQTTFQNHFEDVVIRNHEESWQTYYEALYNAGQTCGEIRAHYAPVLQNQRQMHGLVRDQFGKVLRDARSSVLEKQEITQAGLNAARSAFNGLYPNDPLLPIYQEFVGHCYQARKAFDMNIQYQEPREDIYRKSVAKAGRSHGQILCYLNEQ